MRLETLHVQIGNEVDDTNGASDKSNVIQFGAGPLDHFK